MNDDGAICQHMGMYEDLPVGDQRTYCPHHQKYDECLYYPVSNDLSHSGAKVKKTFL